MMDLTKTNNAGNSVDYNFMRKLAAEIRKKTIQAMASIGFGHIGGSMSIAEPTCLLKIWVLCETYPK
jgi:transketolase N-terminal domain/subunit